MSEKKMRTRDFRISDYAKSYDGVWKVFIGDDLGYVDAEHLREVADRLDQLNAGIDPWEVKEEIADADAGPAA